MYGSFIYFKIIETTDIWKKVMKHIDRWIWIVDFVAHKPISAWTNSQETGQRDETYRGMTQRTKRSYVQRDDTTY